MAKYMIHVDNSYTGGLSATLTEFDGTWRALLENLNGVTDENRDEEYEEEEGPSRKFPTEYTDAELLTLVEEANGDGCNYTTVFEAQPDGSWTQVLG